MIKETRDKCINCNICNRNCYFLNKHNINLKDFTYRSDLRYNCFLCNKCQSVCPKDLSGKEIFMEMRKEDIRGALDEKFELYFSCLDRYNREIFEDIGKFLENGFIDQYKDIDCCGLGGAALSNEKDIKGYIKEKWKIHKRFYLYLLCIMFLPIFFL